MFTLFPPRKGSLSTQGQRDMPTSRAGSSRAGSIRERSISPIRSHRRIPTANDFPVPGDCQPFAVKVRDQGLVSPAPSSFTFTDNESPLVHALTPPSPSPPLSHTFSTPRNEFEKETMLQAITRGVPRDGLPTSKSTRTLQEREMTRKKSMDYQDYFSNRESNLTPEDRVYNISVITVEVKTNVIVRDEYLFLEELSQHLSQRYQRPTSCIFITLDHSACLLFAGTFDSAYVLTIHALSSQLQPATNKRNTALIQSHMASSLGVLPDRGIIRFFPIADEFLATKGTTYSGHIERLQRKKSDEPLKVVRSASPDRFTDVEATAIIPHLTIDRNKKNRQSLLIRTRPSTTSTPKRQFQSEPASMATSPTLQRSQPVSSPAAQISPPIPSIPWDNNPMDRKAGKVQRLGKRKSFFTIFGRSPHA